MKETHLAHRNMVIPDWSFRLFKCLLLISLLAINGCGYRLSGTGSSLPPHIKTIAIPVLKNKSSEPTIHPRLTNTIRRAFLTDGRLKLVDDPQKAHLVLHGILDFYDIRAVTFDANDRAIEYWVYLGIKVDVKDRVKGKTYQKENLRTRWDYRPTANVVNAEASRQEALDEAFRDVSIRLVSLIIDQF